MKTGELLTSSSIDVTGGDLLWDKLWHQHDDRGWSTLHEKKKMCAARRRRAGPTETVRETVQMGKEEKKAGEQRR